MRRKTIKDAFISGIVIGLFLLGILYGIGHYAWYIGYMDSLADFILLGETKYIEKAKYEYPDTYKRIKEREIKAKQ